MKVHPPLLWWFVLVLFLKMLQLILNVWAEHCFFLFQVAASIFKSQKQTKHLLKSNQSSQKKKARKSQSPNMYQNGPQIVSISPPRRPSMRRRWRSAAPWSSNRPWRSSRRPAGPRRCSAGSWRLGGQKEKRHVVSPKGRHRTKNDEFWFFESEFTLRLFFRTFCQDDFFCLLISLFWIWTMWQGVALFFFAVTSMYVVPVVTTASFCVSQIGTPQRYLVGSPGTAEEAERRCWEAAERKGLADPSCLEKNLACFVGWFVFFDMFDMGWCSGWIFDYVLASNWFHSVLRIECFKFSLARPGTEGKGEATAGNAGEKGKAAPGTAEEGAKSWALDRIGLVEKNGSLNRSTDINRLFVFKLLWSALSSALWFAKNC